MIYYVAIKMSIIKNYKNMANAEGKVLNEKKPECKIVLMP